MTANATGHRRHASRSARWRTWLPLRLPAHRASSATLAGAYPFLASAPLDRGTYVGTDAFTGGPFCFDPWTLYGEGLLTVSASSAGELDAACAATEAAAAQAMCEIRKLVGQQGQAFAAGALPLARGGM